MASKTESQTETLPAALPADAPRVRLVSNQPQESPAEWTLTEPVTIIGWGGSSNLLLDDKGMSKMQCLVVNTARDVLLRDLHSPNQTSLNDEPTTFAVLSDGDRIGVGATTLTVHIESAPPEPTNLLRDPLKLPGSLALEDTVSPEKAVLEKAVTLLGRRESLDIHLDDAEISPAHGVIFVCDNQPTYLDLGSRKGSTVNHQPQQQCPLNEGDMLCLGPFEVRIGLGNWPKPGSRPASTSRPAGAASDSDAPLLDRRASLPVMKAKELDGLQGLRRKVSELCEELLAYRGRLANWESELSTYADRLTTGGQPQGNELSPSGAANQPTPPEAGPGSQGPQEALERFGEALDRAKDVLAGESAEPDGSGPGQESPQPTGEAGAPGDAPKPPAQDRPEAAGQGAKKSSTDAGEAAPTDKHDSQADQKPAEARQDPPGQASAEAAKPASTKTSSPESGPEPTQRSEINSMDLDPEVAEQLRLMRRLNPNVGDVELLQQIEDEQQSANGKPGGKKATWWSRK